MQNIWWAIMKFYEWPLGIVDCLRIYACLPGRYFPFTNDLTGKLPIIMFCFSVNWNNLSVPAGKQAYHQFFIYLFGEYTGETYTGAVFGQMIIILLLEWWFVSNLV